jgi:hypothetical protein
MTRAQRSKLILRELEARPHDSDRAVARRVGVDHKTVGAVRRTITLKLPHPLDGTSNNGVGEAFVDARIKRAVEWYDPKLTPEQRAAYDELPRLPNNRIRIPGVAPVDTATPSRTFSGSPFERVMCRRPHNGTEYLPRGFVTAPRVWGVPIGAPNAQQQLNELLDWTWPAPPRFAMDEPSWALLAARQAQRHTPWLRSINCTRTG